MYEGDSFFTLSVPGQFGLVCVSLALAVFTLGLTRLLTFHRPYILRPFIWGVVFISFVWLSPQAYYTYYRMIIDGLPAQSVIQDPPRPEALLAFMSFSDRQTLSAHSVGIQGWLMLAVALLPRRKRSCPKGQER